MLKEILNLLAPGCPRSVAREGQGGEATSEAREVEAEDLERRVDSHHTEHVLGGKESECAPPGGIPKRVLQSSTAEEDSTSGEIGSLQGLKCHETKSLVALCGYSIYFR